MTSLQIIDGNFQITDPDWPRYQIWLRGREYTSDSFSVDGDPVGRMTDAALGGIPAKWEGAAGAWSVSDGRVTATDKTGNLMMKVPGADFEMSFLINAIPKAGFYFVARRSSLNYSSSMTQLLILLDAWGSVTVREVSGGTTPLGTGSGSFGVGDTLTIRVKGEDVDILRNGVSIVSVKTSLLGAGYAGFYTGATGSEMSLGQMVVTAR